MADDFDDPDAYDKGESTDESPTVQVADPMRPQAGKNGRYNGIPNPVSGKTSSWQRVTNFVKLVDDTHFLELWKQRNVAKGLALLVRTGRVSLDELAVLDVKADKNRINAMCSAAQDAAEAYKMADEGTALHKSAELADKAGGDLSAVPEMHRYKVRLYLDALASHGITIVPGMVERFTVSDRYECAGTFDRIGRIPDGSFVVLDLKTGDSIDLAAPSIAGQLQAYEDGINNHGIWNGFRFDSSIQVRDDFGVVVHLPSTRNEVTVVPIDLAQGRRINEANLVVKETRRIKAKHVVLPLSVLDKPHPDEVDQHWIEQLNAAHTYSDLVTVANRAKYFGQWNERLAVQARNLSVELNAVV